jgi:hypothetical protein
MQPVRELFGHRALQALHNLFSVAAELMEINGGRFFRLALGPPDRENGGQEDAWRVGMRLAWSVIAAIIVGALAFRLADLMFPNV